MNKKIELDISSTPYTIDTYQTFTFEGEDDYILESLNEDSKKEITYDDVDWTYDCKGYVQDLATSWAELMNANIIDSVIKKITLDGKAYSPKYYNFATDNCNVVFEVDYKRLKAYIAKHQTDYDKNHIRSYDGYMCFMDKNEVMLHYYLHNESNRKYDHFESYHYDQIEGVPAMEYITYKKIT